jgi:profilin
MSWQAYVDTNLVGSGSVTQAGIYDLAGNPWAYTQSPPFAAQVAEMAAVATAMGGDPTSLAGSGAVVAGVKYMFVSGDAAEVYVKKGNTGVVFCKCNTCMLVGYHDDKIQPGAARTAVGKLADFLKEQGI